MSDLLAGLGIALVAEGLLWALAPDLALRTLAIAAATPRAQLRAAAWGAVAAGVAIVWLVRG
jgi:hypothetical protein